MKTNLTTIFPHVISISRFRPYLEACHGDVSQAVNLYLWNIEISAAFIGELHLVEVSLRNALNHSLTIHYGRDDWWNSENLLVTATQEKMLAQVFERVEAKYSRLGKAPSSNEIISNLTFGFWNTFLSSGKSKQFETKYWTKGMYKAFPKFKGSRKELHAVLEEIRMARNRIAHHESILKLNLNSLHENIVEVTHYLSPEMSQLVREMSRVPGILSRRELGLNSLIALSF